MFEYLRAEAQYHSALLKINGYTEGGRPLVGNYYSQKGLLNVEEALSLKLLGTAYYDNDPNRIKYKKIVLDKEYIPFNRPPSTDNLAVSYQILEEGGVISDKVVRNGQSLDWSNGGSVALGSRSSGSKVNRMIAKNNSFIRNSGSGLSIYNVNDFEVSNCTFIDCCEKTEDLGYLYTWGRNQSSGGVVKNCSFINTRAIRKGRGWPQAGFGITAPYGAWVYGVQIDDNRGDVIIDNCFFDGLTVAIIINGGDNVIIRDCTFGPRTKMHLWVIGGGKVLVENSPTFDQNKVLHHTGIPQIFNNSVLISPQHSLI